MQFVTMLGRSHSRRKALLFTFALLSHNVGAGPVLASGVLLLTNGAGDSVFHYQISTPAPLGAFVTAGSGGLNDPRGIAFGPDGNVYVVGVTPATFSTPPISNVVRYNGQTGAFIDVFATVSGNGFAIEFGPDGHLYLVISSANGAVRRINGATGADMGNFVDIGGGLRSPRDLAFGPDGNLYVASPDSPDEVRRFNGMTGALIDVFASGVDARGLAFGSNGNLRATTSFATTD